VEVPLKPWVPFGEKGGKSFSLLERALWQSHSNPPSIFSIAFLSVQHGPRPAAFRRTRYFSTEAPAPLLFLSRSRGPLPDLCLLGVELEGSGTGSL
jgi:hypothetical protein